MRKEENRRKRQQKLELEEKYPKYLFYQCEVCEEYKYYTDYKPIIDDITGETYFIKDKYYPVGILLDLEENKVYNVQDLVCKDCKKNEK